MPDKTYIAKRKRYREVIFAKAKLGGEADACACWRKTERANQSKRNWASCEARKFEPSDERLQDQTQDNI